ncbi:PREDICTED: uncharacterized protein LOC106111735 [Papilio polytes]|uniref:uncharacterized protein LOC106111735 n=1 Tax=Papilio polytes TaxID=76194 RepID=UPI000675DBF1|nr:PREDICTED: uncharacterized protein LOC106111735 [Papilio polytes]
MEFADRVFLFHDKTLIFGGTPAYMFFKYGREYRLRLAFDAGLLENDAMAEILRRAQGAGARVRANLGTMLILMVPAFPTATVAAFIKELTINTKEYGITSIHISVPDSQEVCQRAINESKSRLPLYETIPPLNLSSSALVQISEHPLWKRKTSGCCGESQIKAFGRKYYAFYAYYKIYFIVMMTSSALAGIAIGLIQSDLLVHLEIDASKSLHGELLNVESRKQNTTLVLLLDNSTDATSVANNYILSDTYSTDAEIDFVEYTALAEKESLTEYLVTRAIDSPQHYVTLYAYGIGIYDKNNTMKCLKPGA